VYFPQSAEDDAGLARRCQQGDAGAFEELVLRYQRLFFTVALRFLGNAEDANDATQNAFVKAYERLGTYDPEYRIFSWLYRILTNECLNMLRDRRPQEPVTESLAAVGGPFEQLEAGERRRHVQAALLELTPDYREVVVLRHYAGLSYDEIAATIGVPSKTVKSRLYTARQQLGVRLLGWNQTK
jgi:RNA polymerase sigma-70 factor (ECF subfamily)